MEELISILNNINNSYEDFVTAIAHYAAKKPSRSEAVLGFLYTHPDATTSDVVKFVSDQPDFMEDAAYMQVG